MMDNLLMTSVEFKEKLDLTWSEFRNHMNILKKHKYIHVSEKFIDNSVKQVINIEMFGVTEFDRLSKVLFEFFGSPDYEDFLTYPDTVDSELDKT